MRSEIKDDERDEMKDEKAARRLKDEFKDVRAEMKADRAEMRDDDEGRRYGYGVDAIQRSIFATDGDELVVLSQHLIATQL